MSALLIMLAIAFTAPLALTESAQRMSGPPSVESDPMSASALTPDTREQPPTLTALMAERFAPGPQHDTTDDHAVRRALAAAARKGR